MSCNQIIQVLNNCENASSKVIPQIHDDKSSQASTEITSISKEISQEAVDQSLDSTLLGLEVTGSISGSDTKENVEKSSHSKLLICLLFCFVCFKDNYYVIVDLVDLTFDIATATLEVPNDDKIHSIFSLEDNSNLSLG